jgi:hypothetical protein
MRIFEGTHSLLVHRSVLFVLVVVSVCFSTAQAQWTTSGNDISNSNSGNVGVGTAAPNALLEVKKDQGTGTEIRVNNFSTSGFAGAYFNGGFAQAAGGFVQWNNTTGLTNFFIGTGGSVPLYLGTNNTARFTILPTSGNVGIGTINPADAFHVFSTTNSVGTIRLQGGNNYAAFMGFWDAGQMLILSNNRHPGTGGNYNASVVGAQITIGTASAPGDLAFYTVSSGATGTGTELVRMKANGRMGVGTANPGYQLDVQGGSINSSGGLCIAGICKTDWSQVGGSQWATSGSTINYSGGNVGVNNSSPVAKLHVSGVGTSGTAAFSGTNNTSHFNHGNGTEDTFIRGGKTTSRVVINDNASGVVLLAQGGGNVGVGTDSPTAKLHVAGTGKFTGDLTVDGNIAAKYQDVAEWVPAAEQLAAGTVVVLDSSKSNQVISSNKSYDTRVAGVISAQPGIMLGEKGDNKVLVATTGRVLVNVEATNGPIEIGDLLVTSDREGVAMRSQPVDIGGVRLHRPGTLIGKALEPLASGTGKILVLLSLQ